MKSVEVVPTKDSRVLMLFATLTSSRITSCSNKSRLTVYYCYLPIHFLIQIIEQKLSFKHALKIALHVVISTKQHFHPTIN